MDLARRRVLRDRAHRLVDMLADPITDLADAIDFADSLTTYIDPEGSPDQILGKTMTTAELCDRAQPPNFLIRNFITAGTLTIWAAPEKAWKTTLATHVALVVSGHGKFLGQYEAMTTGPVMFFSGESGAWPLKSMMTRILDWSYPSPFTGFNGESVSMVPDASQIPIFWGADPPDLGNPSAVSALKKRIIELGATLLILDPSQALFGSISEDVKNDFAMRQYIKKLQLLARETGCCVLLLHHFRQHVLPGFPKRSDSSYGAFTKFCDTWILANVREAPTGDEQPGSGALWLTWGSRDGFGGSHAIDVAEGTHETGRYFSLAVSDVGPALDKLAERAAARKGQSQKATRQASVTSRRTEIRDALQGRTEAISRETLAGVIGLSRQSLAPTVNAMLETGELVGGPVKYGNHGKVCWTTGLALPETISTIIESAKRWGWKPSEPATGATGGTGVNSDDLTPVARRGDAPPAQPP